MEEIWKDIEGYEGLYRVNTNGVVESLPREVINGTGGRFMSKPKIMNHHKDNMGYIRVALCKNGKMTKTKLHRILAIAFIPNPENKPQINHINSIRDDFRLENLEWVTAGENLKHCYGHNRKKRFSPMDGMYNNRNYIPRDVNQYTLDGEFVAYYESLADAERKTGISKSSIGNNCAGQRKTCSGFIFKYATKSVQETPVPSVESIQDTCTKSTQEKQLSLF